MPRRPYRPLPPGAPRRAGGFTLIELLVVMTISAILLAVGVPMFQNAIASMRASEAANSMVASLELARVEALRRGTTVSLCRVTSTDSPSCSNAAANSFDGSDWAAGWMVFANLGGSADNQFDSGDDPIQIQAPFASGSATRAQVIDTGGAVVVTFRPDGLRVTGGSALTFRVAYPQAAQGSGISCRQVAVDISGRTATTRVNC